ncbi:TetR/AcrR family transcriptional regulator [Streptomyces sp. GQFP]|uniref:TetR/AcrR family transcriptional regulator n=1 Tax=Streptomyces sp. GQFP TaxID=2907545 RepID=UPI001F1DB29F|nr:TetR/AcrR family transcriptional regulator [Streptomyces sp. GQFP]UIX29150.1 TetR/AcrR family transcriptional regulator [Streptomyces sp. GQFP]
MSAARTGEQTSAPASERTKPSRAPNRWGEGGRLRQEILQAAEHLLEQGERPEEISLRAIAREAGITAPAIYKHFKDKAELMWTLLDGVYTTLAEDMRTAQRSAPDDPWTGLRAVIDTYGRIATAEPRRYHLLFRIGPDLPPLPDAQPHPMGVVLDAWIEAVAPCLPKSVPVAEGSLDAEQTAKLLWSGLHGQFGLYWNIPDAAKPLGRTELDALRESLLLTLFGPRPDRHP